MTRIQRQQTYILTVNITTYCESLLLIIDRYIERKAHTSNRTFDIHQVCLRLEHLIRFFQNKQCVFFFHPPFLVEMCFQVRMIGFEATGLGIGNVEFGIGGFVRCWRIDLDNEKMK